MRAIFLYLSAAVALFLCFSCGSGDEVIRPPDVTPEATCVLGAKGVCWWQHCRVTTAGQPVHCRIWNKAGLILEDESFLPYDGGAAPTADELKIPADPKFSGPDRIFLANGRVLLPSSRFDELKKFVDWSNGKRQESR